MKIVFFVMNQKGYGVLQSFLEEFGARAIQYVVTETDENVEKDYYIEIKEICEMHSVKIYRKSNNLPVFEGYKIAIGWKWIIKDTSRLVILHDSLLPKYRGFSPLVNMLINGERVIGVTALKASKNYDEGDILLQKSRRIDYPIKIQEAIAIVSNLYSEIVIAIYNNLVLFNQLNGVPQVHSEATYSLWRDEDDYFVDWHESASKLKRTVDALSFPFLGALTILNKEIIRLKEVEIFPDVIVENRDVGKVIFFNNGLPVIVCGDGLLKIIEATDEDNNSILPLRKFRSRFEGKQNENSI
ncbi:hypothetical protein BHE17_11945 [Planococcus maritimus]|uniref:methionyl-tRNA formyltransferase n=1 Tax=Planococcus maritimus TaxID=192421 RepID=UPI00084CD1AB|nr:formyltransferase family protein [Planococcus maritimus]OED33124.1 hypothetical protein BHE17_11945 [Planococcus maritimus]